MGYEREKEISGGDVLIGLQLGVILMGSTIIAAAAMGEFDHPGVVDCGKERQGSISLTIPQNGEFPMTFVDGNKDISFTQNPDGSLVIHFNKGQKTIHLLSGETVTASQISLEPGKELSFEDNGVTVEVSESSIKDGRVDVQITGVCKNLGK